MVEFEQNSKLQYDLILGTETMKQLCIVLDFKAKMITIDEIILPMRNITHLQGNNSLAMEPKRELDAAKQVTQILYAKYDKADLWSIIRDNCKHLSAKHQKKLQQLLRKYELLFVSRSPSGI